MLKKGKGRGGKSSKKKSLRTVAVYQKSLIICLLNLDNRKYWFDRFPVDIRAYSARIGRLAVLVLIGFVSLEAPGCAGIVFAAMLANKLYNVAGAIFVGILSAIPCINLITWMVVNGKATRMLRDKGITVGFLGADLSDF